MTSSNCSFLVIVAVMAGAFAWVGTWAVRQLSPFVGLVDVPNERSSHVKPTPRGGGLSFVIIAPILAGLTASKLDIAMPSGTWAMILGSLLIAAVSLADDRWRLPARVRFAAHVCGAVILMAAGGVAREASLPGGVVWPLGWLSYPFTILWIVGLTNAFNFMDGIDGLAAGQAVIAAATMAWLSQMHRLDGVGIVMLILACSSLGFLLHNWPPARIFMGDVGSAFLGFTFAGWAVLSGGSQSSGLPLVAWMGVLALFLFDTGVTLVSRIIRRQPWYEAHREHFYQRLIRNGWSHLTVTLLYLSVALFLGLVTVAYYSYGTIGPITFVGLVVLPLLGIAALVRWVEARVADHPIR